MPKKGAYIALPQKSNPRRKAFNVCNPAMREWWSDKEMLKKPHDEIHRIAKERITFPLACFLVAAGPNCYFCYTWGWLGEYGTFDWYPEFDKPLGPPKGEAIRKGWTYQREFAHASVFVDLENKTAKIDWR